MNTENFITAIRNIIINNTSLTSAYSPDLPQSVANTCAITLLNGNTINNLCNTVNYTTLLFRVLIIGNTNDKDTRAITDEVFNALHLLKDYSFTGGKIINIYATNTPTFVSRDENQNIYYNITFNANVEEV